MIDIYTILGIGGAIVSVGLFLPQIIRNYRTKRSKGLSVITYIMILLLDVQWTIWGLAILNYILGLASLFSLICTVVILLQKTRYDRNE